MASIKISILGDVCPTEDYRDLWDNGKAFDSIASMISASDLAIANLECPATKYAKPMMKCGPCLRAEPLDVVLLKQKGFSLLSLANNHIKDYQEQGVLDTLQLCKENGIAYVGAGENCEEAKKARFFEMKGRRIGVLSFAEKEFNIATETEAGANLFDVYESPEYIADCKKKCDYLIVLYHGGIEHYRYPSEELQKKCRLMIRFGADIVICQHSHCIGACEYYENGYILYGQGNGVYGYRDGNQAWNEGLLLTIELSDKPIIKETLLLATKESVVCASGEIAEKRMQQFYEESKKLHNKQFLKEEWIQFCRKNGAINRPLFYGKSRIAIATNRITKNKLFRAMMPKSREMVTMNLIRCDAWREVITTLLEFDIYGE